jgi:hypothetical protein
MIEELGMVLKEAVVAYLELLSQHLPGGNEENYENSQSR